MALDKMQIAALRKADRVAFHHRDGRSFINATKETTPTADDPYAPPERTIEIPVEDTWEIYEMPNGEEKFGTQDKASRDLFKGFVMIHSAQFDPEWQTICRLLKVGDTLSLHWARGAWTNPYLKDRHMAGDYMALRITRPNKSPGPPYTVMSFIVGHYVGPASSSVRMITPA